MYIVLALLCLLCTASICRYRKNRPGILLLADGEDEDIKIADGHFSSSRSEDSSEIAAREFLRQKQSGNIKRARELGAVFARALLMPEEGPLAGALSRKPMQMQHHIYLLYTYVVNRVIAEHSPDSILAQTSLNVFYSEIETASPEVFRHVNDMAAFSLYILCERSRNRSDDEIGRIFAELCGMKDDPETFRYGNELFHKLYEACAEKIRGTPYAPVDGE